MITKQLWGRTPDGVEIQLYTLTNRNGLSLQVTSFGARIVTMMTPDRDGKFANINKAPNTLEGFLANNNCFGATIGRYCNRIAGASFELDGVTYQTLNNDSGNTLHGGKHVHIRPWDSAEDGERVVMTLLSSDGDDGFPGNMTMVAQYRLTDDDTLVIIYEAVTDKPTVCSMTNHAYWQLGGPVAGYEMQLGADEYLQPNEKKIPIAIAPVDGTQFDFRSRRVIGTDLFDHHLVFNGKQPQAKVWDPATGRSMELTTDLPGMQVFTSPVWGTNPTICDALCLEAQFAPDSPHHPEWPTTILRPSELWKHEIRLTFGVE